MSDSAICKRCNKEILVNKKESRTQFKGMHAICFHLEFEHVGDPDAPCNVGACIQRQNQWILERLEILGINYAHLTSGVLPVALQRDAVPIETVKAITKSFNGIDDAILFQLEKEIAKKIDRVGVNALTKSEIVVAAIQGLNRELGNGGFAQFFYNSSREFAPYILNSLQMIGCPETGKLTMKAIQALGLADLGDSNELREKTSEMSATVSKKLRKIDAAYDRSKEDVLVNLLDYVEKHQNEILKTIHGIPEQELE